MKTVLIVDSRPDARAALSRLFSTQYHVETAGSAQAALDQINANNDNSPPDLVIMDMSAPGIHGLPKLVNELRDREIPVVFLSCEEDQAQPVTAYAQDLITRPFDLAELLNRVRCILDNPAVGELELTPRQFEILTMLARGALDAEIAQALGLTERTVKHHVQTASRRLGANSRGHLVAIAVSKHLIRLH